VRREVPLVITFVVGVLVFLNYIIAGNIPGTELTFQTIMGQYLNPWQMIITAFAVGLASVNLIRIHSGYIARKRAGWYNSAALLIALVVFTVLETWKVLIPAPGSWRVVLAGRLFDHILTPLGAASFALLAFYLGSASYRAFRARSLEAGVLLVGAIIVMLGAAPIGALIWDKFPVWQSWLLNVPNVTGTRAIIIGGAIGGFATSLRILLGLDRGYLGGGE
jgi:hypothetical protein